MDEENFIEIKYRELVEIGLSDEYIGLYTSEKNERLRDVFSSLHNQFILLFKTMNERLPTKDEGAHFWAEPSRQLIKIIDITFELYNSLKGSNFSFTINEYYQLGNRTFCNPTYRKNRILSNKMSFFHARHAQCHGIYDTITMSRITVSNNDTVHGV